MSHRTRWMLGALVIAVLAGGTFWARTRTLEVAVIYPVRKDATKSVAFDGVVRPIDVNEIRCPFTYERVRRISVNDGQVIRSGQPVVELDDTEARADVARAVAELHDANAALPGAIAHHRSELLDQSRRIDAFLSMERERDREARAEVERARREDPPAWVQKAEADAAKAASSLAYLQDARRGMDRRLAHIDDELAVRDARGRMKGARVRLAAARKRLGDMVLRSRSTGLVMRRLVSPGQHVARYQPLVEIVDFGSLGVGVCLPANLRKGGTVQGISYRELLYPRYARDRWDGRTAAIPGADAVVQFAAFPGKEYTGSVESGVRIENGEDIMLVRVAGVPMQLRPGMSAKVRVITDRFDDALTLPPDAFVDLAKGTAVLVVRGGRVARQPVEVALWSRAEAVVTNGLAEGDAVVRHPLGVKIGRLVRGVPAMG